MAISDIFNFNQATGTLTVPSYAQVLDYLKTEFRLIYGDDIYIDDDSMDGQLLALFALSVFDTMQAAETCYNAIAPSTGVGTYLSNTVKINGLQRQSATRSSVDLLISGAVGTTITNGVASDNLNQNWLFDSATIGLGGTVTVTALAENAGAINALANTITTIATPTAGWVSVNNLAGATIGRDEESDGQLRLRQTISTSLPSVSPLAAIIGAILNLDGVAKASGYDNDTDTEAENGTPAHSIAIVVDGGDSQEIGQTIYNKKTLGTGTFGTTEIDIEDQYGIETTIRFFRPASITVHVKIELDALDGYLSGYADQIKAAVLAYVNNLELGVSVYASKLYNVANLPENPSVSNTYNITDILLSTNGTTFNSNPIIINFFQKASLILANIDVEVA